MDADFIHDLFADFGRVEVKRMFSGQGIYAGGVIFAIVAGDVIYLKTDDTTRPAFEREHATALTFTKKTGQRMVTSYWPWRVPTKCAESLPKSPSKYLPRKRARKKPGESPGFDR